MAAVGDAVLAELNAVRTDPKAYAAHLKPRLELFEGNLFKAPGKTPLMTQEGPDAVTEAIAALESGSPLPKLERISPGLCTAAGEHAADLAKSGSTGHEGSDGSSPYDRMSRHGQWSGAAAENLSFGDGDARKHVTQLLIDDGVPNRGHRANILNPSMRVLGMAEGPHAKFGSVQVHVMASEYTEGGAGGGAAAPVATSVQPAAGAAAAPPPTASAPAVPAADAPKEKLKPPPGGRIDVKKSMYTSGNKKVTTVTTITTQADGSQSTVVETTEEIVG